MHTYLDDLFVYSDTIEEHQIHLERVFAQLRKHEFYLRKDKCELYADSIDCLGHRIDDKGLHADAEDKRVEHTTQFQQCTKVLGPSTISSTFFTGCDGVH
jgi:hypothetical protein